MKKEVPSQHVLSLNLSEDVLHALLKCSGYILPS